jgi:hypothetical protein
MKLKLEVEIDTKEDQQEIDDFSSLITEFKDKLIALQDDEYYDD